MAAISWVFYTWVLDELRMVGDDDELSFWASYNMFSMDSQNIDRRRRWAVGTAPGAWAELDIDPRGSVLNIQDLKNPIATGNTFTLTW